MKKRLVLSALISFSNLIFAQNIIGSWQGALEFSGSKLPLIFHLKGTPDDIVATMDSPSQHAKSIPMTAATFINNQLSIRAEPLNLFFAGKLKEQQITGKFMQNGLSFDLTLTPLDDSKITAVNRPQTPKPPFDYITEEISFINPKDGNLLAGTLALPKDSQAKTLVILINGSGQQNRNSEFFDHQPFFVIADDFAKKGIATLRLDDRGIGESTSGNIDDTTENFAGDIDAAVEFLNSNGYKNIGLLGHSEGGIIAPMVAVKNSNVKYIISLAGPGVAISELMYQQNKDILALTDFPKNFIEKDLKTKKQLFDYLANYKGKDIKNDFNQFLNTKIESISEEEKQAYAHLTTPWMMTFMKYNPADNWSKITIPVLALNGSLDTQVASKPNLKAIKKALAQAKNQHYRTEELPNLNHLFQTATTGNPNEYGEISETFSPKALNMITDWILELKL